MGRRFSVVLASIILIVLMTAPIAFPVLTLFLDPVHGVAGAGLIPNRYDGVFRVNGLSGEARVSYDEYNIPYIEATSDEAGFYAVGWVTASLRLFQMDLYRRVALGNLSSLVGEAGVESDKLSLTLGLRESIEETWNILKSRPELSDVVDALDAYSRGVNDYIEYAMENGLLPVEYRILGKEPERWEPIHSLSIAKLLSLMLAWDTDDLVLNELVRRHGYDIIVDLDVVNRTRNIAHARCQDATSVGQVLGSRVVASMPPPSHEILEYLDGTVWWSEASNNWVVSPGYTESGYPLLANDPHLRLTAPPIWIILVLDLPGLEAAGVTVPGTPFIVIGRNSDIAWGFTNVGSDFVDFYYYTWRNGKYLYRGDWLEPEKRHYTLNIWDPRSRTYTTIDFTVNYTVHGPLLERGDEKFAVKFTGSDPSLEIIFIYLLNKAKNVREALEAQKFFTSPVQNLVVADRHGNIAYSPNGAYPARANLPLIETSKGAIVNTGFLPFNGSNGEGEWTGYIPFDQLPVLYNPDLPYIATANSRPLDGACWAGMGWNYADRFRTQRIYELLDTLLREDGSLSVEDMMRIQLDTRDYSLETIAKILLQVTPKAEASQELGLLQDWLSNPSTDIDSTKTPLVLAWTYMFHKRIWEELYGSSSNRYFFKVEHLEAIADAYIRGEEWPSKYLGGKDLGSLALEALHQARNILDEYSGGTEITYGKLHYYNIDNPVVLLHITGDPAAGGPYSVNVAPPATLDAVKGAPVEVGPSVRLVSDLSKPVLYISLPGGESGNPYSVHYRDLYEKWYNGEYLEIKLGGVYGEPSLVFEGVP